MPFQLWPVGQHIQHANHSNQRWAVKLLRRHKNLFTFGNSSIFLHLIAFTVYTGAFLSA